MSILNHDNYHSKSMNLLYMSNSQYGQWIKCEAKTLAVINGGWIEKPKTHYLVGNYFDKTLLNSPDLESFVKANQDYVFTKTGSKRADFLAADAMVKRCKKDSYFMKSIDGTPQVIIECELFGVMWKMMIDVVQLSISGIADIKTVGQGIDALSWDNDLATRVPFYEKFGYWRQIALYREGYKAEYGEYPKTCRIAAVSKQDPPDIRVLEFDNKRRFDREITSICEKLPRIIKIKQGEIPAERCEDCDYCRATRVLTGAEKATSETTMTITFEEFANMEGKEL